MYRRPLSHGLGLLAFLLASAAQADVEYWVSVASHKSFAAAEAAKQDASARLPETFSIKEADTGIGFYYRVVAGPYLSKEIADHMVGEAKRIGFDQAWVLMTESLSASASDYRPNPDSATESYPAAVPRSSLQPVEPTDIPGFNAPDRPERDHGHNLIDEAPPGYQLHRLNRDQAAID